MGRASNKPAGLMQNLWRPRDKYGLYSGIAGAAEEKGGLVNTHVKK